jgi:hypothetical protein
MAEGGTLRQVIEADKEGFLEYLGEVVKSHRESQASAGTQRTANREGGIIDGLLIAMRAVRAWKSYPAREWLFGLTADQWFHLASEGPDSEVQPCCGTIGELRDLLREILPFQAEHEWMFRADQCRRIVQIVEEDDPDDHGLNSKTTFPLLHKVIDGIRAEIAAHETFLGTSASFPGPVITGEPGSPSSP